MRSPTRTVDRSGRQGDHRRRRKWPVLDRDRDLDGPPELSEPDSDRADGQRGATQVQVGTSARRTVRGAEHIGTGLGNGRGPRDRRRRILAQVPPEQIRGTVSVQHSSETSL